MKLAQAGVWIGRAAVAIAVGFVTWNGLRFNPRFEKDPLMQLALSVFASIMCFLMLWIITKRE